MLDRNKVKHVYHLLRKKGNQDDIRTFWKPKHYLNKIISSLP